MKKPLPFRRWRTRIFIWTWRRSSEFRNARSSASSPAAAGDGDGKSAPATRTRPAPRSADRLRGASRMEFLPPARGARSLEPARQRLTFEAKMNIGEIGRDGLDLAGRDSERALRAESGFGDEPVILAGAFDREPHGGERVGSGTQGALDLDGDDRPPPRPFERGEVRRVSAGLRAHFEKRGHLLVQRDHAGRGLRRTGR